MVFQPLPLNRDTLTNLLNEGTERDGLDFKGVCDLRNTADKVELAKDLGAMQMYGGYIVIGADDRGRPTGKVTEAHAKLLDQATLHDKVKPYLADGFEIRSTALDFNGDRYGMICVLPYRDGLAPFKASGFYKDSKNRDQTAFRAGDLFTRRGSRSEPWSHEDVRHIRATIRREEREVARNELQQDYLAMQRAAQRATTAADAPADTLTWSLDAETLTSAITEQLRRDDDIPLITLLKSARRTAGEIAATGSLEDVETLLDGLTCVVARLIVIERWQYAERAVDVLQDIYNSTFTTTGHTRADLGVEGAAVHLAVIARVQALGALAVRDRQWSMARYLVERQVADHDADYWATWLFHGEVSAARANLMGDRERPSGKSPLVMAQEHIMRLGALRSDIAADGDAVITSLCQFDILAAFVTLSVPNDKRVAGFLAYFGEFWAHRTDPIVVQLIKGGELRAIVFPQDDKALAAAIRVVGYNASRMAMRTNGWDGWSAQPILNFLKDHPRSDGTTVNRF